MAIGVNFVSDTRKRLTNAQKQDLKYFQKLILVVAGAFAIFLLTLAIRFFFILQVKQITDRQNEVRAAIAAEEKLEEEYTIFAHKLKQLTQLFGKRKDKQEALIFFNEVFGPEVQVSGIDYSGTDEDVLSFTLSAPNVFLLERVFDILKSAAVTDQYKAVEKEGVRRRADGAYAMQLTLTFGEVKKPAEDAAPPPAETDDLTDEIEGLE